MHPVDQRQTRRWQKRQAHRKAKLRKMARRPSANRLHVLVRAHVAVREEHSRRWRHVKQLVPRLPGRAVGDPHPKTFRSLAAWLRRTIPASGR